MANSVDSIEVVVTSTPLIALGSIGRMELLKDLFDEVVVPDAAYEARLRFSGTSLRTARPSSTTSVEA